MRLSFLILTLILLLSARFAQGDVLVDYHPVNIPFWQAVDAHLNRKDWGAILREASEQSNRVKKDSSEYAEAKLATALAVKGLGFTYLAARLFGDVVKSTLGTDVGHQALAGLEELARNGLVDEDYVYGEIANDLEYDGLSKGLTDFISYQQGLFDLLHGFESWSDANFGKINPGSYWDFKLKYFWALKDVAKDKLDGALDKFTALVTNDATPTDVKSSATHQQARLIFEKGDYVQAYKIFKKVQLNPRERGLILLERAWAKYYQKDYSKALGLLVALEAPYFDSSRTPEPYILKMVIYKELCYYGAAFSVVKEFNSHFNTSLDAIRRRRDLKKDQGLVNLAVLDQGIERWVNFLNLLKEEKSQLSSFNLENLSFLKNTQRSYDLEIGQIRLKLDIALKDKIRKVADQLLDWQEQLNFLDYQTRLDSLRVIKPKSELPYRSEEIPHLNFEKTYWLNQGEIWFDELEDYKVLIESRCDAGISAPESDSPKGLIK